ncbi:hypothetical protein B0H13DRAFT_1922933 [Mycena leptocephala]|nr:hypothetical protein B0H13DRAFT_1922933 [Mycena leptocephala]
MARGSHSSSAQLVFVSEAEMSCFGIHFPKFSAAAIPRVLLPSKSSGQRTPGPMIIAWEDAFNLFYTIMPRYQLEAAIALNASAGLSALFLYLTRPKQGKIQLPVHAPEETS